MTHKRDRHGRLWPLLLGLLWLAESGVADELGEARERLERVQQDITQLRQQQNALRRDEVGAREALAASEQQIDRLHRRQRALAAERGVVESALDELAAERRALDQALAGQRAGLAVQLRAAYASGSDGRLRLLLNHDDPVTAARQLTYHGYLSRQRVEQIRHIETLAAASRQLERQQHEERQRLVELEQQQRRQQQDLAREQRERERLLQSVARELADADSDLQRLEADQRELGEVIDLLQRRLGGRPAMRPFTELRGQLLRPAEGRIRHGFGSRRGEGGLTWNGVVIAAGEGAPVRAVATGQVVMTEWLRGYGLVLILDHGDGWLSLYAHNRTLNREVGEWVEAGDVIGEAGSSGGQLQAGIYFEIRHNGQAVDPARWWRRG